MNDKSRKAMFAKLKTQTDVDSWFASKINEYGSKGKFTSSNEYRIAYPELVKIHKKEMTKLSDNALIAMKEHGHKFGDRVEYSQASPFGLIQNYNGLLYKDKYGLPKVKLDDSRKSIKWHKGFIKR